MSTGDDNADDDSIGMKNYNIIKLKQLVCNIKSQIIHCEPSYFVPYSIIEV